MIAPFFQQLASKYREVIFAKIDTDEAKEVAAACKVASLWVLYHLNMYI